MHITIKDIAKKSKTSVATVSRVINNSPKVAPHTRSRVLKILKKFEYKPNQIAKGLVKGKSKTISLITPASEKFFNAFYFREIFLGINRAAENAGYNILIAPSGADRNVSMIERFPVEGCILVSPETDDPIVKKIEKDNLPAVFINARSKKCSWVDLDNKSSAYAIVRDLISMGHKKIAVVKGKDNVQNSADRLEGYFEALRDHNCVIKKEHIIEGGFYEREAYIGVKKNFSKLKEVSAIFALNDNMAVGAISALKEKGINVPRDISVAGFDDIELASYFNPPITTVKQPLYMMGYVGLKTLIKQLKGEIKSKVEREFRGEIIHRKSTAPLRKET